MPACCIGKRALSVRAEGEVTITASSASVGERHQIKKKTGEEMQAQTNDRGSPDASPKERELRDLVTRIKKLRWIGQTDEAAQLERQIQGRCPPFSEISELDEPPAKSSREK